MATRKDKTLRPQLQRLFNLGAMRDRTDGQLLERFATDQGELAELAFAALIERHGAMVMRACRARLSNTADAQDAFQATFLILVKKARSLWVQDSLGPWLHQVALRTASCARANAARRRKHERQAAEHAATAGPREPEFDTDLGRRLHEEIDRLPERYRLPIVLCDLQGHTCEEAARRMGRPIGTVKSWRSRGRERLRHRLIRAGLAPTDTLEAVLAADVAQGAIARPEAATVRAASQIRTHTDRTAPGEVPASVWVLVKGVMKTMLLSKLRTAAAITMALALFGAGLGVFARGATDGPKEAIPERPSDAIAPAMIPIPQSILSTPDEPARVAWNLTLHDAIRIGLKNSEWVRLLKPNASAGAENGDEIIPRNPDQDRSRLKIELMAHVRSIAQRYWNLAQQHAQLWNSERAVELAEEIKKREEGELQNGRGTVANVAEATQRLEQFRLDLLSKTSDVLTTERELRDFLGLPKADERRIVPASPPNVEKVSQDWESSLALMMKNQPEIAEAKSLLRDAESRLAAARRRNLDETIPSLDVEKQKAFLDYIIHQYSRFLSKSYHDNNATYQLFQTAKRLRNASQQRLEAQRAFHEAGRITIDRYLDAVSQHASAGAQEALFSTTYNIGLATYEEVQGTLLNRWHLSIAEGPKTRVSSAPKIAEGPKTRVSPAPKRVNPAQVAEQESPVASDSNPASSSSPQTNAALTKAQNSNTDLLTKEVSFEVTIPIHPKPITIRGSFSINPASEAKPKADAAP